MMKLAVVVVSGLTFGLGITVSGMVNPAKVVAFLDIAGDWDPSLAVVLAGATGATILTFSFILKRPRPILDSKFHVPTRADVDFMLVLGAAVFGIGWGIVGFCPGPAYATLLQGHWEALVIFVSMIAGMATFRFGSAYAARIRSPNRSRKN